MCGGDLIQCNAMVESLQKIALLYSIPKTSFASQYNRANSNALHSSNRGIVTGFSGATRDLAHSSLTIVFLSLSLERMYRHASYPTLLASQNP